MSTHRANDERVYAYAHHDFHQMTFSASRLYPGDLEGAWSRCMFHLTRPLAKGRVGPACWKPLPEFTWACPFGEYKAGVGDGGEWSNHLPCPPCISGGLVPIREKGGNSPCPQEELFALCLCMRHVRVWAMSFLSSPPLYHKDRLSSSPITTFSELSSKSAGPCSAKIWFDILLAPKTIGL